MSLCLGRGWGTVFEKQIFQEICGGAGVFPTDLWARCTSPIWDVVPRACGDFFWQLKLYLAKPILEKEVPMDPNAFPFIILPEQKHLSCLTASSLLSWPLLTSGSCLTVAVAATDVRATQALIPGGCLLGFRSHVSHAGWQKPA